MVVKVVIPARDEERLLPETLGAIEVAASRLHRERAAETETIVVDNASRDATASIAAGLGAAVVGAPEGSIGAVRNAGAARACGEILVFVDADVALPADALTRFVGTLDDDSCSGGFATVIHRPRRRILRAYLAAYCLFARVVGMSQGSAQFCRRSVFDAIGGYDETIFMGEDVDFMRRVRRTGRAPRLRDVCVQPSTRRFDSWPLWKTLVLTNPLLIRPLMRRRRAWAGWYGGNAPR